MTVSGGRVFATTNGAQAAAVLGRLRSQFATARTEERVERITYFDTFDARLHAAGLVLRGAEGALRLAAIDGTEKGRVDLAKPPAFAWDLPAGPLRETIADEIEMRRLLAVVEIEKTVRSLPVLDELEKTVVRVVIESSVARDPRDTARRAALPDLVRVVPVRGHAGPLRRVVGFLEEELAPAGDATDELVRATAALGRPIVEFPCKLRIRLDPEEPAHAAARTILGTLLDIITLNEDGMRRRVDTEFLHDFRVSVRRTRSALTQIKGVFPESDLLRFRDDFKWLGSITGPARDADVFLLKLPEYRRRLPEAAGADLGPLATYLEQRQDLAYRDLVAALDTPRYGALIHDWRAYLAGPAVRARGKADAAPNAARPARSVATERIGRVLRKALKMGERIDDDTPAARLHELRIQRKKLRYLLDFYSSLYDRDAIARLIRALKKLQDNLGDFNDCEVQQEALQGFARDMAAAGEVPVETFLAMGRLEDSLQVQQEHERRRFTKQFARFAAQDNRRLMRELFPPGGERE